MPQQRTPGAPGAPATRPGECDHHILQVYDSGEQLADAVSRFVAPALADGRGAFVMTTPSHRRDIEARLSASGTDLNLAARAGQYVVLDAAAALSQLVTPRGIDRARLDAFVRATLDPMLDRWSEMAVYGEMAPMLWARGEPQRALELEGLWEALATRHGFPLLCTYPLDLFSGSTGTREMEAVLGCHGKVFPGGACQSITASDAQRRTVVLLQQKAAAYDHESGRRRLSEEHYRQLTALLPVGVYTCQAPSGEITYYNDKAAELWGRTPAIGDRAEVFCGSYRLRRVDGTILPKDECPMAAALRDGVATRNEEVIVERPDGTTVIALVNIDPIRDADGRIVGAVNVFHDVTDLRRAERALREADRRKDEFLATLAHELRNPLAPIRHSLSLLRFAGRDQSLDPTPLYVVMERQLAQLVRLVDDLLELSRITRGTIELREEPVEIPTIIMNAIETCRPLIDARHHHLRVDLPAGPLVVRGDPVRLSQVFANILNNAARYTEPGGTITLRAHRDRDVVVVSVVDTGIGIAADLLPHIFEMFSRASHSQWAHDGLGIGLNLVHTLVAMHGGTVHASSEGPNRGSEFVVRLPALVEPRPASHVRAEGADSSTQPIRMPSVLVVDDNQDAADSLRMLLELAGAPVDVAYDGASALTRMQSLHPAVVFLDIGMPGMDGYEVARHVRANPAIARTVLVALTGWGADEDRRRSEEAGFDHHLVKPVEFETVQSLLRSLVAGAAEP